VSDFGPIQIGSYQLSPNEWETYANNGSNDWKYSLTYAYLMQQGLPHEEAVQGAQMEAYGKVRSQKPLPMTESNWRWAGVPLQSELDLPSDAPRTSPGQQELLTLLEEAEARAAGTIPLVAEEVKANAEKIAAAVQEKRPALSEYTPTGRRLAGGYAVTGGLGLLGLLGLAAVTDPYRTVPKPQPAVEVA
jgi:hypothetical protein